MSRLIRNKGDSVSAVARLSSVANSFGSVTFEWLCIATGILCFAANGAMRRAASIVAEAVMISAPNALAISNPRSISASVKLSPFFRLNLDIGHFTAANYDAVAYIREHHASITNLHLKDRKKEQGPNTAWGTGDTPIRDVLQLLKKERWPIRAYIEYEHRGDAGPVEEVKKCYAFAKSALA